MGSGNVTATQSLELRVGEREREREGGGREERERKREEMYLEGEKKEERHCHALGKKKEREQALRKERAGKGLGILHRESCSRVLHPVGFYVEVAGEYRNGIFIRVPNVSPQGYGLQEAIS